jgi:uncharacterized protein YebE (UPF0316 family)
MDSLSFMDSNLYTWVILPFLIFLARICDQTIGTIRIMFISRGNKVIVPILGFFEVLIWVIAIRQIINNLSNVIGYVAYAGGFATGNLVGLYVEEKIALGKRLVRIITQKDASKLVSALAGEGYGATNIRAEGNRGKVNVIYTVIDRYDLDKILGLIERFNPKGFYTVEDVLSVKEGVFPSKRTVVSRTLGRPPRFIKRVRIFGWLRMLRKDK